MRGATAHCLTRRESGTAKISETLNRSSCPSLTCSAEDFPANLFLLQDIGEDSLTQEARFSLSLPGWLKRESLHICCLRTYPACFTMTAAGRLRRSSMSWKEWGMAAKSC